MKIQVRLNNYRRSARKVREISSVLKGLNVADALNQLEVMQKGSAYDVKNLLVSAIATAENDFNLNKKDLILGEIMVQEGKTLKRWRARAYGRANQILKRTCHIILTVEEKVLTAEKDDAMKKVEKDVKKKSEKKSEKGKNSPKADRPKAEKTEKTSKKDTKKDMAGKNDKKKVTKK